MAILFWFYRDVTVCENRLRQLRRLNPGVPVFGLFGGPPDQIPIVEARLGRLVDDLWSYPEDRTAEWKWRNGDLMILSWFSDRGRTLPWDSVLLAQWDLLMLKGFGAFVPDLEKGEMLLSGLRPVREVEPWWQWLRGEARRAEYEEFISHVSARYGHVAEPMCCQFITGVIPRGFLERYGAIAEPELGFLEYKVPVYAQVFGTPLVGDTCFRPLWPEEPGAATTRSARTLLHAWPSALPSRVVLAEAVRPGGRRVFHPYHGVFPHDLRSIPELARHAAEDRRRRSELRSASTSSASRSSERRPHTA